MQGRQLVPIFRSFDEDKARDFYVGFLGFQVAFEHRFGPDMPLYRGLTFGDLELHFSEHHGDATPGSAVRIDMDDVKAYCAPLLARPYKFARPGIERQDWGYDEMKVLDPFGNRLVFCSPVPRINTTDQEEATK